jgi:riboflavin kinase/FMN adenylyltransferase
MPNKIRVKPASRVFTGTVQKGNQLGRTIGFPTVNLDASILPIDTKPGVYAAATEIDGQHFAGALYYGPRLVLNETITVLEIHILDFSQEIYGKILSFQLDHWVRGVLDFDTFPELQEQLEKDIRDVRAHFSSFTDNSREEVI